MNKLVLQAQQTQPKSFIPNCYFIVHVLNDKMLQQRTGNPNHTQRPHVNLDVGFNIMYKYQIP